METSGNFQPRELSNRAMPQERMLDSDEAAALLRIHPKTLQRMARLGTVRACRVGKLWRFRGSDLLVDLSMQNPSGDTRPI